VLGAPCVWLLPLLWCGGRKGRGGGGAGTCGGCCYLDRLCVRFMIADQVPPVKAIAMPWQTHAQLSNRRGSD